MKGMSYLHPQSPSYVRLRTLRTLGVQNENKFRLGISVQYSSNILHVICSILCTLTRIRMQVEIYEKFVYLSHIMRLPNTTKKKKKPGPLLCMTALHSRIYTLRFRLFNSRQLLLHISIKKKTNLRALNQALQLTLRNIIIKPCFNYTHICGYE